MKVVIKKLIPLKKKKLILYAIFYRKVKTRLL